MATRIAEPASLTFRDELSICRRLLGARVRSQLQYRASFAMQIVGTLLVQGAELIAILALFSTVDELAGWRSGEVVFLYAVSYIAFAIAHVSSTGLQGFSRMVVRGEFDRVLTRPLNPYMQVLASDVNLRHIGGVASGCFAFVLAMSLVDIDWTLGKVIYLPIFIVSTSALYVMLFTLEATLCFWTTESNEAVNAVTYGGKTLAVYPLNIYDVWLRRFFLFIVPLGFVIFLPATYILDKPLPFDFPGWTRFIAPLAALLFGLFSARCWQLGISRYRSTGS